MRNKIQEYRWDYRFPWEFIFCTWRFRHALKIWLFYKWTDKMRNLWIDRGYRILGIELTIRRYATKTSL